MINILNEIILTYKKNLLKDDLISTFCYYYLQDRSSLNEVLTVTKIKGEKQIYISGYIGKKLTRKQIDKLKNQIIKKGFHYTYDIFCLIGLYLASPNSFEQEIKKKFSYSDIKIKYLIFKINDIFKDKLLQDLEQQNNILSTILLYVIDQGQIQEIDSSIQWLINREDFDVIDLIILEDLQKNLLSNSLPTFLNKNALDLVLEILSRFNNSIKKITINRRKGKEKFKIENEYDVQDILCTIFQSIFPKIEIESFNPQTGGRSSRVEFFIEEYGIMVETKMIKESDNSHRKYITGIQEDMELYHKRTKLKDLIFFIYDPFKITLSNNDFYSLEGEQTKRGHRFNVKVVIQN